ncbi:MULTISPECIES: hypothetical protein [unclassified Mesorhizobium]|uniref:hypothetical protein n=2 Tax=unclassified Mesorhizobium TaxID=325217 RepID=UPI0033360E46
MGRNVVARNQLPFPPADGEAINRVSSYSYKIVSHRTDAGELASLWSLLPVELPELDRHCRKDRRHTGKCYMNKLVLALALGAVAIASPMSSASAGPAPCEGTLKTLRAAEAEAKLGDTDKTKVSELETKGIERCNADDDKRADDFFAQAMKILGK